MAKKRYAFDYRSVETLVYAANISIKTEDAQELYELALTGDCEIALDADAEPAPGDRVIFKLTSDATARNTSFGNGFIGPDVAGVINKTKVVAFVFDGTNFIAEGPAVQID